MDTAHLVSMKSFQNSTQPASHKGLVVPDQHGSTGKVREVRRNVSNSGDPSPGDQLQTRPWSNRTRRLQPVAISQKGRRAGDHTKGGRLQSHGAGQQVAQQGRGQGLSAKSAHTAGIHQSQEHVANHVEVLLRPLREKEGKARKKLLPLGPDLVASTLTHGSLVFVDPVLLHIHPQQHCPHRPSHCLCFLQCRRAYIT